jgi:hypothetical protein
MRQTALQNTAAPDGSFLTRRPSGLDVDLCFGAAEVEEERGVEAELLGQLQVLLAACLLTISATYA